MRAKVPSTTREHQPAAERQELRVLARGGLALGASTGLGALLSIPAVALLVRSLGLRDYGTLAFALGLTQLASTVADLGLSTGVTRMSSFAETDDSTPWAKPGVRLAAISGFIATAVCLGVALVLPAPSRTVLFAASAIPFVTTVRSVLAAYLRTRRRIALVEGSYAVGQLLYYSGAMALVALGVATAPRVALLRTVVLGAVLVFMLPKWKQLTNQATRRPGAYSALLRFSFPLLIAGVAWLVLQASDVIMLGLVRGPRAVGLYSPVLQTVDLISLGMFVLATYYLPLASAIVGRGDFDGLRSLYATVTKWGLILTAPLLSALIVAPRPLLRALFGSHYGGTAATLIARILCIGYAISILTGQNGFSLIALGKSKAIGIRSAVALVLNVLVNALLIPRLGAVGAAIGTSSVYVGLNLTNSVLIWRTARLTPVRKDALLVLGVISGLTLGSAIAIRFLQWQDFIGASLLTAALVGAGAMLTWLLTSSADERRAWRPRLRAPS
jgi:O-antigen/teichoic acid export membrane protein